MLTKRTRALLQARNLLEALACARTTGLPPELKADSEHLLRCANTRLPSALSRSLRPVPLCCRDRRGPGAECGASTTA